MSAKRVLVMNEWTAAFYEDAGLRISVQRKRRKKTQEDVAKELNISRAALANVESGRQRITVDRLWKLAVILGVPLSALVPEPLALPSCDPEAV